MENEIFTPKETPKLKDVLNNDQEDVEYQGLNNPVNDEIHTFAMRGELEIPESEEVVTGEPMMVNITDQIITPKKNIIDFQGYELDNISEADGENDVPPIKQVRKIIDDMDKEKQDKLTAGDNITITSDNVISAVDTTYSAGSGITLTDTTFSIGTKAIETGMIDDGAVTNGKISENAVTTTEIADEAITTAKIGDYQITEDKLASNSVSTDKIVDSNVTASKLDWTTLLRVSTDGTRTSYIFADGTLIATRNVNETVDITTSWGSIYKGNSTDSWSLASTDDVDFISEPTVTISPRSTSGTSYWIGMNENCFPELPTGGRWRMPSGAWMYLRAESRSSVSAGVSLFAFGRWKN